mmetsp:Transcript_2547/g.9231  ORF Transcript_2547/g.9231 Transcript_2547/m.9231 type:complete len:243 (+) Transcript_2547:8175-8903(+)
MGLMTAFFASLTTSVTPSPMELKSGSKKAKKAAKMFVATASGNEKSRISKPMVHVGSGNPALSVAGANGLSPSFSGHGMSYDKSSTDSGKISSSGSEISIFGAPHEPKCAFSRRAVYSGTFSVVPRSLFRSNFRTRSWLRTCPKWSCLPLPIGAAPRDALVKTLVIFFKTSFASEGNAALMRSFTTSSTRSGIPVIVLDTADVISFALFGMVVMRSETTSLMSSMVFVTAFLALLTAPTDAS